jgi:hypothetical protein
VIAGRDHSRVAPWTRRISKRCSPETFRFLYRYLKIAEIENAYVPIPAAMLSGFALLGRPVRYSSSFYL